MQCIIFMHFPCWTVSAHALPHYDLKRDNLKREQQHVLMFVCTSLVLFSVLFAAIYVMGFLGQKALAIFCLLRALFLHVKTLFFGPLLRNMMLSSFSALSIVLQMAGGKMRKILTFPRLFYSFNFIPGLISKNTCGSLSPLESESDVSLY